MSQNTLVKPETLAIVEKMTKVAASIPAEALPPGVKSQVKSLTLFCNSDACDWELDATKETVYLYHNEQCPKCGQTTIVTDEELAEFVALNAVLDRMDADITEDDPGVIREDWTYDSSVGDFNKE